MGISLHITSAVEAPVCCSQHTRCAELKRFLGNITIKPDKAPAPAPSSTPTLKSKAYTTGRGGTGNIVENTDPEVARKAQDVDVPGITLPEGDYHTGRGTLFGRCDGACSNRE